MKTLLIDDLRNFRDSHLPPGETVIARTSEQALQILNDTPEGFDCIWFDHDLGINPETGKDDTTIRVVDFLAERAFNGNPYPVVMVYIHTANPVGARNIQATLNNWDYVNTRVDASEYFISTTTWD